MIIFKIYMCGVIVTFIFLVIGIKAYQNEDYDKANHDDKKMILFTKHKETLLILLMAVASLLWGMILPAILLVAMYPKKEARDE